MKNSILIFGLLFFATQPSFSQKIFFAKENYTDSTLFQKNIPTLAKQVASLYKEADSSKYLDNLFRVQLLANRYEAVEPILTRLALINFGDTVNTKAFGFVYKIFSATMATNPTVDEFARVYDQKFTEAYQALSTDGKNWAAEYFDRNPGEILAAFTKNKEANLNQDSLTIEKAVALCRSYCAAISYTATFSLAKQLLLRIEQEQYIKQDSILIKMPDGGTISLTIVRNKKTTSALPAVLMFDIYSSSDMAGRCKEIASRGYVGIIADTRGKRLSPDAIEPFEYDAKDAYYIIDWISKQPWCDGKVGMYGGSYLGFSQWSATKYLHPALKTIVPQVAVAPGIEFPSHNGIFMGYMLMWIKFVTNNKLTDNALFLDTEKWYNLFANWYKNGQSFRSLDSLAGGQDKLFQRWLQHPVYDSYWQKMTPQKEEYAKINIPILTITGYWDSDQVGAMYYYQQHQKFNTRANHYLLIGPYDHAGSQGYPKRTLGGYTLDDTANIPIMDIVFQWFDHTLKGSAPPAFLKNKVNFQVMGKNEWKHVSALSEMSNDTLTLFLGNTPDKNRYPLLKTKSAKLDFTKQSVDLKDRSDLKLKVEDFSAGPVLVDSVLTPADHHLVFVSEVVDEPIAISGALNASVTVATNKKDMDVTLSLYELTPDGKYIALGTNWQRASYAKDRTKRNLLISGRIQTFEIAPTYITCKQLQKGSRIVVVLGINKSPQWQINYGSGKDVSDETMQDAQVPMEIKWYNSSYVKLPILR